MTWWEAKIKCKNLAPSEYERRHELWLDGGNLASIPNEFVNEWLWKEITPDPAWIGGKWTGRRGDLNNQNWEWIDGRGNQYSNWADTEIEKHPRERLIYMVFNVNSRMGLWGMDNGLWADIETRHIRGASEGIGVYGYICQYYVKRLNG